MSIRSTDASAITASRSVVMANPNWPLILAGFSGARPNTTTWSTSDRSVGRLQSRRTTGH
jgi:hypothetical protein